MTRIIEATERLLKERDYEDLTIAEIAAESKSSISSLYARFRDKSAIVLAIFERESESVISRFSSICQPEVDDDVSLEEFLYTIFTGFNAWFEDISFASQAVIRAVDHNLLEAMAQRRVVASEILSESISEHFPELDSRNVEKWADFAIYLLMAGWDKRSIFGSIKTCRFPMTNEEFNRNLARLISTAINS